MKTKSIPMIVFVALVVVSIVAAVIANNFEIFAGGCLVASTFLVFWMTREKLEGHMVAIALYVSLATVLVGSVVSDSIRQNKIDYYHSWNGSYQASDEAGILFAFKETSPDATGVNGEYYIFDSENRLSEQGVIHGYYSYAGEHSLKMDCQLLKDPVVVQVEDGIVFLYETKDGYMNIYAEKKGDAVKILDTGTPNLDYTENTTE